MIRFFEKINEWLSQRKGLTAAFLLLFVCFCVASGLRLDYEEDIAKFLPEGAVKALPAEEAGDPVVVIFRNDPTGEAQAAFADLWEGEALAAECPIADETDLLGRWLDQMPLLLEARDYERMDSLLGQEGFVGAALRNDLALMNLPMGDAGRLLLQTDPLGLFPKGGKGLEGASMLVMLSALGRSDSGGNAALKAALERVGKAVEGRVEGAQVSAISAGLVAAGNAERIKTDSLVAVGVAVVLILALLVWHYRRLSDLLWLGAAVAFGWIFALGILGLAKESISLIVMGIGSVIIGIAVNYPLHYLDHLRETGDGRQTLRDMVPPLLIGNVTTVSAFLCLVFLDAAAMRDLGWFGGLMLIGTILFVLVVMPVFVRPKACKPAVSAPKETVGETQVRSRGKRDKWLALSILCITLALGWLSLRTSFDGDLRNINYMTENQRIDMAAMSELQGLNVPSAEVQRERLAAWDDFWTLRRDSVLAELQRECGVLGIRAEAFQPFEQLVTQQKEVAAEGMDGSVASALVQTLQDSFNYVGWVCGFVVFFFLWISFGSIELALLSFLPLAVSWLWILGLMQLLGIQFNIVNVILATFIFGQGDDYTIFMTEGLMQEYTTGRPRLASYKRSIGLSAVLMFIGMGCLVFARHPALRSLGAVTVVGMAVVVLMAYVLPPLVFRWLVHGQTASEAQLFGKLPITLSRMASSAAMIGVGVALMYGFLMPYTWCLFRFGKATAAKKLRYHRLLQRLSRWVIGSVPGSRFSVRNAVGETFERPAVVVSNHQSHLDLMCLMSLTPKLVVITNNWAWHNPFYASVIHRADFCNASEGFEQNFEKLEALFRQGYSILVFPEGTRSTDGRIGRFHKGAFLLAQRLGADVLPVYLHGVGQVLPKRDFMLRRGPMLMEVGERIHLQTNDLLAESKAVRAKFRARYEQICRERETEDYLRPFRRYVETYKTKEI